MGLNGHNRHLSTESEVRNFLEKYPPGTKLRRALSNPYALRKKISCEGKSALILKLTQDKVIDILDIDTYLLTHEEYIDLFAYCLRLLENIEKNTKNGNSQKRNSWHKALNVIKKLAKSIIPKNKDSLEYLLEQIVNRTIGIICKKEEVDLLMNVYNRLELGNERAIAYTKQILYALLPLMETSEELKEITGPMLEFVNYKTDPGLLRLYQENKQRLLTIK